MKILALAGNIGAVNWYRIQNPLRDLADIKTDEETINLQTLPSLFKKYDVVVTKYITDIEILSHILAAKHASGVKLLVDIDDDVFNIPETNIAYDHWHPDRIEIYKFFLQNVDGLVVSTQPLKESLLQYNPNIIVIPNRIDPDMWKGKKKTNDVVKIGWTFSKTHIPDAHVIREALKEVKEKYGDKVEIEIVQGHFSGAKAIDPVPFKDLAKTMRTIWGWDIAIGPLADNQFNRGKSNIKWLEATMADMAFVGAKVYPYEHSIVHGKTGMIAGSKNQWVNCLAELIENEALRKELVKNAKEVVLKEYNIKERNEWNTI